jgi:hypothetical protein
MKCIEVHISWKYNACSDSFMCPGVDSASKNEYQVNPGGKGSRCIRLTTYHLHVLMSSNLGALTSWNPMGLFRPVMGQLFTMHANSRSYWKNYNKIRRLWK